MGCDIHMVVEQRVKDKWVTLRTFDGDEYKRARARNYGRFAALAGVRGDGPEPRGIPVDASETARLLIDQWGGDGHSHSWLPVSEAAPLFAATQYFCTDDKGYDGVKGEYIRSDPASYFFDLDTERVTRCPTCKHETRTGLEIYRLVFWFDN